MDSSPCRWFDEISILIYHTNMPSAKIAITLDQKLLHELDALVAQDVFNNRSQAIQSAVSEALIRQRKTRLAQECAKLDPLEEKAFAEMGMDSELDTWPAY
jgi:Arc/MetJ-type ribon-helix-helix transcriptional regulator